jgi:hypothetical protein
MARVVADTSPLIALQQIGHLDLLQTLFGTVLIPSAVAAEALSVDRPEWLIERPLTKPLPLEVTSADLEPGEREAIALALETILTGGVIPKHPRCEGERPSGTRGVESKMRSFEMSRTVVVKGRVVGPSTVELETPLPEEVRDVEVTAHVGERVEGKLSDYLRSLPPGTRTKEDIDQQIREERGYWS